MVTKQDLAFWKSEGYLVVRGLMSAAEVADIKQHFDAFGEAARPVENYWVPDLTEAGTKDPLKRYPRVMQPHRWDGGFSKKYLLHPKVRAVLEALYGEPAVATQSMFYYKPPGARGQALHQDNFYLQVQPGTCIAAWTAIDPATPDNGGLFVVPGTQNMEIACPEEADPTESAFVHLVRAPNGTKAIPTELAPGDTLFFNGSLIHGSGPNRSKTMWRRSFICHYMQQSARHIAKAYAPLMDFAGNVVEYDTSDVGGPCGKEFDATKYGSYGKWH